MSQLPPHGAPWPEYGDSHPIGYSTINACRVCGESDLEDLFSLGDHYVSDFVKEDKIHSGNKVPIDIVICNNCQLVQQLHTAPQEILYALHYWYKSGVTQTMRDHLYGLADEIESSYLEDGDVVLDIGSNDGTLLRYYSNESVTTVGVEPALNLAEEGSVDIDIFLNSFWHYETYDAKVGKKAKVITALGMFYDLEDPNQFIADVAKALAPDGIFIAQLMCLQNMINVSDIGNLCHEHLEFYSLASLTYLLEKHGLEIYDWKINSINGQSYRLYIRHIQSSRLHRVLPEEPEATKKGVKYWFSQMEENRKRVLNVVASLKTTSEEIWLYGASTKGNTLLQYYGLDSSLIDGAAERSPSKYGLYTIGTGIPIYSEEIARQVAKYFVVLPYAFLEEFKKREVVWRSKGGKFIVPLPELQVV